MYLHIRLQARAEKYEEDLAAGRAKLNEDQLLAVEKKGEVVALVKELEEVLKQMEDKDAEVGRRVVE